MYSLVRLVKSQQRAVIDNGELPVEKLDAYLTIKEAAAFLGVSPNTLRNWGREGKVVMHRNPINGYRLFKKSDLEQLLREIEKSGKHGSRKSTVGRK